MKRAGKMIAYYSPYREWWIAEEWTQAARSHHFSLFMSCVRGYLDSQQKIGIIFSYEGNFASMTL